MTIEELQDQTLKVFGRFKGLPPEFQERMLNKFDLIIESENDADIKSFLTLLKEECARCAE